MSKFIQRQFEDINSDKIDFFNNIIKIQKTNIFMILGEPASGKSYQFIEYKKKHDNTYFVELINLTDEENIEDDIKVVLIDSIDEALLDYSNTKKLQIKLTNFIRKCQRKNPEIKFVISCRFLEWSHYFEISLKNIDKELSVYKILPLLKDDINRILKEKIITKKEFWTFVDENYLTPLLSNILVLLHIIDNFKTYQQQSLNFIDIYHDIVKKYLLKRGNDRREENTNIPIERLIKISSSLATYMTFNRKQSVGVSNLDELAGELYKINGNTIIANELKIVLDTALFDKKVDGFIFFHKSVQEYLTAYFLSDRKLSIEQLKDLLASELRFYEEFEEIDVYLTNMENELFDVFVEFDPFIFKRHPSLTAQQQEKLLLSILHKYKTDVSQTWDRLKSFDNSSLVIFDKIDNLIEILKENVDFKVYGTYLMKLLENNYNKEFKNYLFELFQNNLADKENLRNIISNNFIDNYDFNLLLYKFLQQSDLLDKDNNAFLLSFNAELFSSLYGIKYKHKYGLVRITQRTKILFLTLLPLLESISPDSLKYIVPYLLKDDVKLWFQYIQENYTDERYSSEYINWIVYASLKNCNTVEELKTIVTIVKEKDFYFYFIDKEEMQLDFDNIADIFWQVYFEINLLEDLFSIQKIISFYTISSKALQKAITQYPIEQYLENYVYFTASHKFLQENELIQVYLSEDRKRIAEQEKKLKEEWKKQEEKKIAIEQKRHERAKLLNDALHNFATDKEIQEDIYNVFYLVSKGNYGEWLNVDKRVKELLKDKYETFIDRLKEKFKTDRSYKEIKKSLTSSSLSNTHTFMFQYLFETVDYKELECIVETKKEYIKLFWHLYRAGHNEVSENFIKLSQKYFECFSLLSLHTLQLSLSLSQNKKIDHYHLLMGVYKKLGKFDYENLQYIISYVQKNDVILTIEEPYQRGIILDILILDINFYEYILKLIQQNKIKMDEYFYILLGINVQKSMEYFYITYNNTKKFRASWTRIKNKIYKKVKVTNKYDKFEINPKKIELYKMLIFSIQKSKVNLDMFELAHIKMILIDYYIFFDEYRTPKGAVYSPDIYDNMYRFIANVWQYMESNSKYIDVLRVLSKSSNTRLSNIAKSTLTKAYEQQRKNRNFSNNYYKKIFDKDKTLKKDTKYDKKIKENFYEKWWFISLSVALIGGAISLWQFNYWIGLAISIVLFIVMMIFNPKRRFFRLGISSLIITGLQFIPFSFSITIPKNTFIYGYLKSENDAFPWFGILMLIASLFLFYLDYKENKK